MDGKITTVLKTKIPNLTIVLWIYLVTFQSVAVAQPTETTTIPTAVFNGVVTKVIDGDTMDVKAKDGKTTSIRLSLVDAPETNEPGYTQAKNFVFQNCLNKEAVVDPDNNQEPSYSRLVAVVYCEGININEALIANGFATIYNSFCDVSEFANTVWAQKFGCGDNANSNKNGPSSKDGENEPVKCDASYPNVCIPSTPPDLDSGEIEHRNFKVLTADPHGFDGDGDSIGCDY
ncbi:MAG TPA: thermonuclease family protein [Phototrophicaceae bacterium]|nr:thermonuclease family protein [Phototrophicaceae bacterium]